MKIFLASTSPRRKQLLAQVGFEFEILNPEVDEIERPGESPRAMVRRFALDKAEAAFQRLPANSTGVLISADTTVVSPDGKRVLNKPTSTRHAEKILKMIAGRHHIVYTGYAIFGFSDGKISKRHYAVVKTSVKMKKLSSRIISEYVESGEPMDKAGAYGAQGIGMSLIESIRGSYSNVIGLPMAEVVSDLEKIFKLKPKWRK
jgi:septum formation protein